MDLSSINNSINNLLNKIKTYLETTPRINEANYEQQQDIVYITNQYNNIVQEYSKLLDLITEVQYFISQCKKVIRLLSDNTSLEKAQKAKVKMAIDLITEAAEPLSNEKERLKVLEMFYRSVYTRREF